MDAVAQHDLIQVLATLDEGVCVLDQQGRVTLVNPAGERLLGWGQRELLGAALPELLPSWHVRGRDWLLADEPVRDRATVLRRKDGSTFAAILSVTPVL